VPAGRWGAAPATPFSLQIGLGKGKGLTRDRVRRQVGSFPSWVNLANRDALVKLAPTLAATLLVWGTMKAAPLCGGTRLAPFAPLFLPAALVFVPAAFQLALLALGVSLQEAADAGWVLQPKARRPARRAPRPRRAEHMVLLAHASGLGHGCGGLPLLVAAVAAALWRASARRQWWQRASRVTIRGPGRNLPLRALRSLARRSGRCIACSTSRTCALTACTGRPRPTRRPRRGPPLPEPLLRTMLFALSGVTSRLGSPAVRA
jgi:hypothetical protein